MEAGKEFGIVRVGWALATHFVWKGRLPLYGHEISDEINVWEAGLERFLKMEKGDFIGRTALERAKADGIKRTLVGLESVDRGIPRDGYKVLDLNGKEIGYVTSGSYAPFLKKNIALAYVPIEHSAIGSEVAVEIRNQPVKCKVVPTPFYKRPKKQS